MLLYELNVKRPYFGPQSIGGFKNLYLASLTRKCLFGISDLSEGEVKKFQLNIK